MVLYTFPCLSWILLTPALLGSNASTPPGTPNPQRVDLVPTLVWVDDEIENIKNGIEYAMVLGIRVIQLPSTIATKLWVEQNDGEDDYQ